MNKVSGAPSPSLNLARKWRSQQFGTIIGQDLCLRMLKNSLYLSSLFPVYLFSGTRGCGKTSTARIFAGALNCQALELFQADPRSIDLPCLMCNSCILMKQGQHPDFIEIDAASHTGVDNVREIIDAASLLPVLGRKKIYLIDEAHMLSKAAFNAFLKILEEPPHSVHFILATTEAHKILETVRSRCFQLFFEPVSVENLTKHLGAICSQEQIAYEPEALKIIAGQVGGSVRDALNLIERVRFSTDCISVKALQSVLHFADQETLIALIELIAQKNRQGVVRALDMIPAATLGSLVFWRQVVEIIQHLLWIHFGVVRASFLVHDERIVALSKAFSGTHLTAMLDILYTAEQQFHKTTAPDIMMQLTFFKFLEVGTSEKKKESTFQLLQEIRSEDPSPSSTAISEKRVHQENVLSPLEESWSHFIGELEKASVDPMVVSVFKQGRFLGPQNHKISLVFGKSLSFFSDTLITHQAVWDPLIKKFFGAGVTCELLFSDDSSFVAKAAVRKPQAVELVEKPVLVGSSDSKSGYNLKQGAKARLVLQYFPGTLSLVGSDYE